MTRTRRSGLALAGPLLGTILLLGGSAALAQGADDAPVPVVSDPDATGTELVTEYVRLIQDGDSTDLAAFLDPGFQIVPANGDHYGRDA